MSVDTSWRRFGSLARGALLLCAFALLFSGCNKSGKTVFDPNLRFGPPLPGGGTGAGTNQSPNAAADAYTASGGATLTVNAASGVLANDTDPDNNVPLTATAFSGASTQAGAVNLASDGSFTYTSAAGFTGTDTFSYTLNDSASGTATGTVTITVSGTSWYVNNQGSATGVGTQADPFDSLAKAQTASAAGDTIFLLTGDGTTTNHTAGIVLKDNQRLIGQGASARLGNAGATGITLANGCTVSDLFVDGASNAIAGTGAAGSTLTNVTVLNSAAGVSFTNATGTHAISNLTVTATNAGIAVTTCPTGTFNVSGASLTTTGGAPGAALFCQTGGNVNLTGTNTINATGTGGIQATSTALNVTLASVATTNSPAQGIEVSGCTGSLTVTGTTAVANNVSLGGITISGATAPTTAFGVVNVTNRTAFGIDVTATAGTIGFGATTITGASASPGVNHQGSGANVTFASLSVTGGTQQGISLNNNTGTFTASGITVLDGQTLASFRVQGAQNAVNLGQLTINNRNAEGILLEATSGTITFGGPTAINARAAGTAAAIRGNTCAATVNFNTSVAVADSGGAGAQLTTCTANWTFNDASIQSTTGEGLLIDGTSTGTFTFPANGSITATTGRAISVSGGSSTLNYTGVINNTAERLLEVANTTGGAVNLTGAGAGLSDTAGRGIRVNVIAGSVTVTNFTITNSTTGAISVEGGGTHTFTNGVITGGTTSLAIGPGSSAVTLNGGSISYAGPSTCLSVGSGIHTGSLTLNAAHTITSTAGLGLRFELARGTYSFNGTANVTGGNRCLLIRNSSGTFTFGPNTSLTTPTGVLVEVNVGSTCNLTYSGNLTQGTAGQPTLRVAGHTTGTLTFQTGTISATDGTGLLFDNADGTYAFNGTTTLNGGDAGIDILSGSAGTFTFGANTTITSPSGVALNLVGGTAAVTYSGGITQANNAAAVSVSGGHATGTLTFNTGTISATNGTGLQFDNADATYAFNGTATLNGGDAGIDILNGSAGTFTFSTNTAITSPSGVAFNLVGGTATVTYSGGITQANSAAAVSISGAHATGTATFQTGAINASSGTGLQFTNADGTYAFNGTTTLNGGDAGIDIRTGSAGTFTFGAATSITSPSGTSISITTLSTCNVVYSGNVTHTSATNGISVSAHSVGTVTFNTGTLSFAGTSAAIRFSTAGGTYNFDGTTSITAGSIGIQVAGSTGTIDFDSAGTHTMALTTSSTAVDVMGAGPVLSYTGAISVASGALCHVATTSGGSVTITGNAPNALDSTSGASGFLFQGADGDVSIRNFRLTGTTSSSGIDIRTGCDGTFVFTNGVIASPLNSVSCLLLDSGTCPVSFIGGSFTTSATGVGAVVVQGGHSGSLTFDAAHTIAATDGTGFQFNNADGTYTFSGTATLNGGDAGIDILNGSAGTFTFGANTTITSPSGAGFLLDASTCAVTYSGDLTQTNTTTGILITTHSTGVVTFNTGTISCSAASGTGINLSAANGTYNFDGTTTFAGGLTAVSTNNCTGTIDFDAAGTHTITLTTSNTAINIAGGTQTFTYTGAVSVQSGVLFSVSSTMGGSVTITGNAANALDSTNGSLGIRLQAAAGSASFTNFRLTGNTNTAAIDITTGSTGTFTFTNGVIANPANGIPCLRLDGGTATANFVGGSFTTAATGTGAINVSGGHATGTLSFNAAHTITATEGTGLQFDDADGTYTFSGTTTLNGGDAGIDVLNGSAGTFTWAATSSITNPTGVGLNVSTPSAPTVTFPGTISKNNTNAVVVITNLTGGSVTATGTLTKTGTGAGGLAISNAANATVSLGTISLGASGARSQTGFSTSACTNLTLSVTSLTVFSDTNPALALSNNTGSLTISGGSVDSTAARCLFASATPATVTLTSATSANSNLDGLRFFNASGSFTIGTITVTSSAQEGIRATSGSATLSLGNATVTRSAANATNEGVEISSHSGTTTFTTLNIDTSAGNQTALFVSNSGTFTVNAGANVIDAGNGRGVDIDNTALSVSLRSVTSDDAGGTLPGIDLSNTTGTFTVTGTGAAGSGGNISNKTGADSSPPTSGVAVVLNNAQGVSLASLNCRDFTNWAIWGNQVNGFVLTGSTINSTGFNGTNAGALEGNLFFTALTGTVTLTNNTISNGLHDNVRIVNTLGTLTATLTNGTIGLNDTTNGGDGLHVEASGSASVTLSATGVAFSGARGSFVDVAASNTANVNVTFTNCDMTNSHTAMAGPGVLIVGGGAASNVTLGYTITGTGAGMIRGGGTAATAIGAQAILVDTLTGSGTATGVISNLFVGVAASLRSGNPIRVRTGGTFAHNVQIDSVTGREIYSASGTAAIDLENAGTAGTTFNAQVVSNNMTCSSDGTNALANVLLHRTTGTSTTGCLRVANNNLDASALPFGQDAVQLLYSDPTGTSGYTIVPNYAGSASGESATACAVGTASADLGTFWAGVTNTLTNGGFPLGANGVDARRVCNAVGGAGSCP